MALVLKDRVKETTTTTGTGTITLGGAVTGFQSFSVIGNANTTYYAIVAQTPGEWEVGIGTYTSAGTTLTRDTVLASSNSGSLVVFSAGTKDVWCDYPAGTAVFASNNAGTSGQVLASNGTGVAPSWQNVPATTLTISNKTGAYTVVSGDNGTIINCTSGSFTVALTAAASLGAGFNCWIWNTSNTTADVITIDPSGAETIDGVSTLLLRRGEGTQIVCDGTNWSTGAKKTMRGYAENITNSQARPVASGNLAIAMGGYSNASTASGTGSIAIHGSATASQGTAIGLNSAGSFATAAGTAGSVALGGSYASGTDSFAAAVANNTSTYGAQGANSIAMGQLVRAAGSDSVVIGGGIGASAGSVATGPNSGCYSAAGASASGQQSIVIGGDSGSVTQAGAVVIGGTAARSAVIGKLVFGGNGNFSGLRASFAECQTGLVVLRRETTDATASVLSTNGSAGSTGNQVILPNNSAYAFTGTIIARQQAAGGSNYAAWEIKGAILRDGTAASTVLGSYNINKLSATAGAAAWTAALTADTTNGGLAVTVTGAAATNIRWVATVMTSEVTYA